MKKNPPRMIQIAATGLLFASTTLLAQGCRTYPYRDGIDPDLIAQNKYVATATATVSLDDVDSVKDAREEATMEAKATLAKFLTEDIQSDTTISKIVNESKTMNSTGKENVRNEAIKRTKLLRNHSQALLRGVITMGDCYTKGTEVRVTVGVKPESINAAEGLAGAINSSLSNPATGSKSNKQPLTSVEEVSNTENLKKF
ncbi:MAG: hypothetical protein ACJ74Z_17155 [Bryobacteraceae bacterium]